MAAFWSGTDNANQKDPILYGVFGHINTEDDFLVKFVWQGENINIPTEVVVDYPQLQATVEPEYAKYVPTQNYGVYKGKFNFSEDFPTAWLYECHKVQPIRLGKRTGYGEGEFEEDSLYPHLTDEDNGLFENDEEATEAESSEQTTVGYDKPLSAYAKEEGEHPGKKQKAKNVRGGSSHEKTKNDKQLPTPRHPFYN